MLRHTYFLGSWFLQTLNLTLNQSEPSVVTWKSPGAAATCSAVWRQTEMVGKPIIYDDIYSALPARVIEGRAHFLKSVTQCCPPSGRIIRSACHWLTHSFKILACLLLADTVVSCQSVSQLSHQPRPVHWTCSVATWIVRSSGTNFPSHFVPKIKSVPY